MKTCFKNCRLQQRFLLIAVLIFAVLQSNGQHIKPAKSGYAPVNGINVYYEVYGEGKPLILLHGSFMTIALNWGELIPELAKTRKVIAIELQGHGHTAYSERKLDFVTLASDVEGIMNHLKVDSADIAGYSFGGYVAYQLAIKSPRRVRKLVIISSTYKNSGWQPEVVDAIKTMKPEFLTNTPLKAAYDAVAPDKTKWTSFVEQMIAFDATPFDMGDANIAKITAPALLIAGDNDGTDKIELMKTYKLLGGLQFADMGTMPKSQLAIIPAQGHVSLMMQTKPISSYMNSFLQ